MAEALVATRFDLTADSAKFEQSLKRATAAMREAQAAGEKAGKVIAAQITRLAGFATAFIGVSNAVQAFNKSVGDTAAIGRLAQQTGITTERLSELRFAAASVGLTFEELNQTIRGFAQRMAEGLTSNASSVSVALNTLGVSARNADGTLRNFDAILPDLADGFSRYADGAAKAQLASALFGEEAGPKLLNLLNRGRGGIAQLTEEARKLGITISSEDVQAAQDFTKAAAAMSGAIDKLVQQLAITFAPLVVQMAQNITQFATRLREPLEWELLRRSEAQVKSFEAEIGRLNARIDLLTFDMEAASAAAMMGDTVARNLELVTDAERKIVEQLRLQSELRQKLAGMFTTTTTPVDDRPQAPDQAGAQQRIEQQRIELEQFMQQVLGERTILETVNMGWMTHADAVEEAQRRIQAAHGNTAEARRRLADVTRALNLQEQNAMLDTADMFGRTLTAIFPKQKGAAIAEAGINTAVAVTKALTSGIPPWNFAQAALVAAAGLAQIRAIQSTSPTGGGSVPSVGGGSGAATEPAAMAPSQALEISIAPGRYSHLEVEAIIEGINERVSQGVTLISTTTGAR